MEYRGRKGGVRDSWDSLLMAINRLTVMTICDKSLGEESPKGFQPQPRQVWGFAKIIQLWWLLKSGEEGEMDQFLPSQRLKILPRGGGKNRPQANSNMVALHLKKKKKKRTKGISKSKRIHVLICQVSLFSAVDPCVSVQIFLGAQAQIRLFRAETSGYTAEVRVMNMY